VVRGNSSTITYGTGAILGRWFNGTGYFNGTIKDLVYYGSEIDSTELKKQDNFLNKKHDVFPELITNSMSSQFGEGILTNGVSYSGNSWVFDGINDYINVDNVLNIIENDTQGTWLVWVKQSDVTPSGLQEIMAFSDANTNERLELAIEGTTGKLRGYCNQANVQQWFIKTDSAAVSDGSWFQAGMVHDGVSTTLYVNGIAVSQSTEAIQNDPTQWVSGLSLIDTGRMGCRVLSSANNSFFDGDIQYSSIYNTALSSSEMLDNYNATKHRFI